MYTQPTFVLLGNLLTCLYVLIGRPLTMLNKAYASPSSPTDIAYQILTRALSRGILYSLAGRIFLLYFDIQWTKASQNGQWTQYIDVSHVETNWFVRNRAKWGNVHWVLTRFWIPIYLISVTLLSFKCPPPPLCPHRSTPPSTPSITEYTVL